MKRRTLIVAVLVGLCMPGCDTKLDDVEHSSNGPVNTEPVDWNEYDVCFLGSGVNCAGFGYDKGTGGDESVECGCQCRVQCNSAADCQAPPSGNGAVACVENRCGIPCDESTICPDGMQCAELLGHSLCGWVSNEPDDCQSEI